MREAGGEEGRGQDGRGQEGEGEGGGAVEVAVKRSMALEAFCFFRKSD